MENKRLGVLLVVIALVVGGGFFYLNSKVMEKGSDEGCYPQGSNCAGIVRTVSFSNIAIGIFSFIFALGFYMLFFNKTEGAIINRLEKEKNDKIEDLKFDILLRALDDYEKRVVKAVREQQGITQNTLRIRTDMSKAKLSYVLKELERREIIKRVEKGKTLEVYLRI